MVQVKIITNSNEEELQKEINAFLSETNSYFERDKFKEIVDIKFQMATGYPRFAAMIVYKI